MKRLIKSVALTNGELYYLQNGNLHTLAHCAPVVEVYEQSTPVPAIGRTAPGVKRFYFELVLCKETAFCREMDSRFFHNTVAFLLKGDVYRPDGVFETVHFDRLDFEELAADGTLTFSTTCPQALAEKLITY